MVVLLEVRVGKMGGPWFWGVEAAIFKMATMGGVVARPRATGSSHFAVC